MSSTNIANNPTNHEAAASSSQGLNDANWRALQQTIDSLQENIAQQQRQVVQLKYKQNKFAPVSILPHELFREIFMYLAKGPPYNDGKRTWLQHVMIFTATHVSSRWRQIALESPQLWSRPYLDHTECAIEMIKRSKSVPLDLVWDNLAAYTRKAVQVGPTITSISTGNPRNGLGDYASNLATLVLPNIRRARSLRMEMLDGWPGFDMLPEGPFLEHVDITFLVARPATAYSLPAPTIPNRKPDPMCMWFLRLVGQHNRSLESVKLSNRSLLIANPTSLTLLASLRRLTILLPPSHLRDQNDQRVSMRRARLCLKELPRLESLSLSHAFLRLQTHVQGEDRGERQVVPLDHLREITLMDGTYECARFLEYLGCPQLKTMNLDLAADISSVSVDPSLLLDVLAVVQPLIRRLGLTAHALELGPNHPGATSSPAPLSAYFLTDTVKLSIVLFPAVEDVPQDYNPRLGHSMIITLPLNLMDALIQRDTISAICGSFRAPALAVLTSPEFDHGQHIWQTLGNLPDISLLRVNGPHTEFLKVFGDEKEDETDSGCYFANLLRLQLAGWDFSQPFHTDTSYLPNPIRGQAFVNLFAELVHCVQVREEADFPLESLEFVHCKGLTRDKIQDLEDFCEVIWDEPL